MKKIKKTLVLVLAFMLIAALSITGTWAYLTATTSEVKNTFTVGDIGALTLKETTTSYNVVPGVDISKDPKVTYTHDGDNDVAVYVFVKVSASDWATTDHKAFTNNVTGKSYGLSFSIADGWTYLLSDGTNHIYYKTVAAATDMAATSVIAGDIVDVSESISAEEISQFANDTLTFTAYAIQQDGLNDAGQAWNAVK